MEDTLVDIILLKPRCAQCLFGFFFLFFIFVAWLIHFYSCHEIVLIMSVISYWDGTNWWEHTSCRCCRQNSGTAGSRPDRWHIKDELLLCPMNAAANVLFLLRNLAPDIIADALITGPLPLP